MRVVALFFLLLTASVGAQAQTPWGYPASPPPSQPSGPIYIPWPPGEPADAPPDAAPALPPPSTAAVPDDQPIAPPTSAYALLAPQNAVRLAVGDPPLTWSGRLAQVAQSWADHLLAAGQFAHTPGDPYGENLYEITGGTAAPQQVVDAWADEARNYNLVDNSCTGVCGHYTQIVWRATRQVGCAVAGNGARQIWVCEYDPPGNVVGYRPF